jgi:hypothetical protein
MGGTWVKNNFSSFKPLVEVIKLSKFLALSFWSFSF